MDDQEETRAWHACEHWPWDDTKARLDQATMTLDAGVKGWDVGKSNELSTKSPPSPGSCKQRRNLFPYHKVPYQGIEALYRA